MLCIPKCFELHPKNLTLNLERNYKKVHQLGCQHPDYEQIYNFHSLVLSNPSQHYLKFNHQDLLHYFDLISKVLLISSHRLKFYSLPIIRQ